MAKAKKQAGEQTTCTCCRKMAVCNSAVIMRTILIGQKTFKKWPSICGDCACIVRIILSGMDVPAEPLPPEAQARVDQAMAMMKGSAEKRAEWLKQHGRRPLPPPRFPGPGE